MSDNYCQCKYCKWVDSGERDGYKWYCERYGMYVDPDKVDECSSYRER